MEQKIIVGNWKNYLNKDESVKLAKKILDEKIPDKIRVMIAVTNGIGVMPAYEGELTPKEIDAISYYVSVSADLP